MRWLRRPPRSADVQLDEVAEVAATLTAASHEAPPSTHAEELRETLLASLDAEARPRSALGTVALAASALLVAIAIAVGGPAIGSLIGTVRDGVVAPPPAPASAEPTPTRALPSETVPEPEPSRASPSTTPTVEPSALPIPSPTPVPTAPINAETIPAPEVQVPPRASPGGPPDPMPTPPINGPPPGVP